MISIKSKEKNSDVFSINKKIDEAVEQYYELLFTLKNGLMIDDDIIYSKQFKEYLNLLKKSKIISKKNVNIK